MDSGTSCDICAGFVEDFGADTWVLGSRGVEMCALMWVLLLSFLALSLVSGHDYRITQGSNVRKNCLADKGPELGPEPDDPDKDFGQHAVPSGCVGHGRIRMTTTSSRSF